MIESEVEMFVKEVKKRVAKSSSLKGKAQNEMKVQPHRMFRDRDVCSLISCKGTNDRDKIEVVK